MNRVLKFRACIPVKDAGERDYHSDGKAKMFYQDDQYLQSFLRRAYMEDCGREHESYISEGFTLLQFTGLTDKNGREIYESDIVRYKGGLLRLVEFGTFKDSGVLQYVGWNIDVPSSDYEVIGNGYENPELMGALS